MRNIFYFLAALIAFGTAFYYYKDVSAQTATVTKLFLVAEDGVVIKAGTTIDEEFMERHIISQDLPAKLAAQYDWALDDNPVTRINLQERVFGQDVAAGSFLRRTHFFLAQENAFARRIKPGYRAVSIPVEADRAVENFILPGARVDVIGAFEISQNNYVSEILLENVEVMAVEDIDSRGEFETRDRPDYDSVTVMAKAELVADYVAKSEAVAGALTLLLRNPCEENGSCDTEVVSQ